MSTIHLIHHSDDLVQALNGYKKLLGWPHDWKVPQKNETPSLDLHDFYIVYNRDPEKLDGLKAAQHLRSNPETFAVPILFISDKLSDYAQLLFDDLDFVWLCEQPFHSRRFFDTVAKVQTYMASNISFLRQANETFNALASGQFTQAKKALNVMADRFQNSLRFHIWSAQVHLGLKELDRALDAALLAQKMRPKSLEVSNLLASIYYKKGDTENYNAIVQQTLRLAEIHLQNLLHWGDVYLEQGNVERSITAFEAALEKEPENQRAKQGILAANLVEGRTNIAGTAEIASAQSMEIARMFNLKGISMAESGHFRTAERLYNNAMKILPNKEIAYKLWLNLGLCMKKKGDLPAALAYFEKCQELAPPHYKRAEAQILALKDELKKEESSKDFSRIKDRVIRQGDVLNYKKIQSQKGA
ncbi:MAG TPA: tetratricopeptide repeat protein [Oligoflexus sp.]|uniref:tetratricopeptide repeat protein n=1 Tax=Oligoflexus sp. TaxID=1971216 RepID=UPI002D7E1976|nr:tetratricopeptide repeat protein [Oligoflexus sp.]HET9238910.1 tetratricopeptide repeat protein [Oligoflexus sp.]